MREGKTVGERINSFRDLRVYKIAFEAAMGIFEVTKEFPKEEKYSLTDQVRRSSRSVCSNIAEAWRKRKYIAVFVNKLSDAGMEASETQTWLEFALRCGYIDKAVFGSLNGKYEHIFAMLNTMGNKAGSFCGPAGKIVRRPSERSERSSIVRR
ncbi:MAG: four helix bundle protein [Candidatus Saganbacteria bacterium]|nr:four helix bundle protein [Candidatus Saganbacteria bacterium]